MMYRPVREEERSSKRFVFALAAFVFCFAFLLIAASILRVKNPELKLTSATLNQIQINFNASSSFNATLITLLSFKNPNYGGVFSYENSNMSVFYKGVKIGDEEIRSEKVKVRGTKRVNVTVNLRSDNVAAVDIADLSSEINSGMLNLTCYAKFRGAIWLLNVFHKRKVVEMACFMSINLTSHAIQSIHC